MSLRNATPTAKSHAYELRRNPTDAEQRLWRFLRNKQIMDVPFRRQHAIGTYIVDFCSPSQRLVIELDGSQHLDHQGYDQNRTEFLESRGYTVLRFWDDEVFKETDAVIKRIAELIELKQGSNPTGKQEK